MLLEPGSSEFEAKSTVEGQNVIDESLEEDTDLNTFCWVWIAAKFPRLSQIACLTWQGLFIDKASLPYKTNINFVSERSSVQIKRHKNMDLSN